MRVLKECIEFSRSDVALGSAANQNGGSTSGILDEPVIAHGSCTVTHFVFLVQNCYEIRNDPAPESQRVDCSDADASRVQEL